MTFPVGYYSSSKLQRTSKLLIDEWQCSLQDNEIRWLPGRSASRSRVSGQSREFSSPTIRKIRPNDLFYETMTCWCEVRSAPFNSRRMLRQRHTTPFFPSRLKCFFQRTKRVKNVVSFIFGKASLGFQDSKSFKSAHVRGGLSLILTEQLDRSTRCTIQSLKATVAHWPLTKPNRKGTSRL